LSFLIKHILELMQVSFLTGYREECPFTAEIGRMGITCQIARSVE